MSLVSSFSSLVSLSLSSVNEPCCYCEQSIEESSAYLSHSFDVTNAFSSSHGLYSHVAAANVIGSRGLLLLHCYWGFCVLCELANYFSLSACSLIHFSRTHTQTLSWQIQQTITVRQSSLCVLGQRWPLLFVLIDVFANLATVPSLDHVSLVRPSRVSHSHTVTSSPFASLTFSLFQYADRLWSYFFIEIIISMDRMIQPLTDKLFFTWLLHFSSHPFPLLLSQPPPYPYRTHY